MHNIILTCYDYQTYNGPKTDDETCSYHPGVPIFHEGWGQFITDVEKQFFHIFRWYFMRMHGFRMKYWSCCKRKTSDFNSFLSQEGCNKGSHQWRKHTVSFASSGQYHMIYYDSQTRVFSVSAGEQSGTMSIWLAPDRKSCDHVYLCKELESWALFCGGELHLGEGVWLCKVMYCAIYVFLPLSSVVMLFIHCLYFCCLINDCFGSWKSVWSLREKKSLSWRWACGGWVSGSLHYLR